MIEVEVLWIESEILWHSVPKRRYWMFVELFRHSEYLYIVSLCSVIGEGNLASVHPMIDYKNMICK